MCIAYNNGQVSTLSRMPSTATPQDRARAFFGGMQATGAALANQAASFKAKPVTTTTTGGMTGAFR
jgi:hypothetical protein